MQVRTSLEQLLLELFWLNPKRNRTHRGKPKWTKGLASSLHCYQEQAAIADLDVAGEVSRNTPERVIEKAPARKTKMRGQTQERSDVGKRMPSFSLGLVLHPFMVTRPNEREQIDEHTLRKHIQKLLVAETRSRLEHEGRIRRIMEVLYQQKRPRDADRVQTATDRDRTLTFGNGENDESSKNLDSDRFVRQFAT